MSLYVAYHHDQPDRVAFMGTLTEVAEAVAAQPNPGFYDVRFHRDGFARLLTPDERTVILAARMANAA